MNGWSWRPDRSGVCGGGGGGGDGITGQGAISTSLRRRAIQNL